MIETATENRGTIFAHDEDGWDIIVGDKVIRNRKLYQVEAMEWCVSGDGLYRETVHLTLRHLKTNKLIVVEDCDVALVE